MSKTGFYDGNPADLPMRVYRNLIEDLGSGLASDQRAVKISAFIEEMKSGHARGEFLKMKLTPPSKLSSMLSPQERYVLEEGLAQLRAKRGSKLHAIYPICSDEFKFENDFFTSVFRDKPDPVFNRDSRVFTIGSCFAVNIARYLSQKGYKIDAFRHSEEINSVFGNALLFAVLLQDEATVIEFVRHSLLSIFPNIPIDEQTEIELAHLKKTRESLTSSEILIVTLGNSIDAFYDVSFAKFQCPNVFPRFFDSLQSFSVKGQASITSALRNMGGSLRLAGILETLPAIKQMFQSLRTLNPTAHVFVTVSPVSINNTMGLSSFASRGPIEADCATKSILRACAEEVLASPEMSHVRYFPSFEIVRWLGSTIGQAAFGAQDASSKHVSEEILASIYDYFEYLYAE